MFVAGEHFLFAVLSESNRDSLRGDRAVSDRGEKVIELRILGKRLEQLVWLELDAEPAKLSFQDLAAVGDVFLTFLPTEPAPDLLARGGGGYIFGR